MGFDQEYSEATSVQGRTLALAESITGGLVASAFTDLPGASRNLLLGVVAYSRGAKERLLHVDRRTMVEHGEVSVECAIEMAMGVRDVSGADLGASCTGIAGPSGGSAAKPVGLVYMACFNGACLWAERHLFSGDRLDIKDQACDQMLRMISDMAQYYRPSTAYRSERG
jgi:PncC family amidohydrolase